MTYDVDEQREGKTVAELIAQDNKGMKATYPKGNHRGTQLSKYYVNGHEVVALTPDQAKNIYHQALVDANKL